MLHKLFIKNLTFTKCYLFLQRHENKLLLFATIDPQDLNKFFLASDYLSSVTIFVPSDYH